MRLEGATINTDFERTRLEELFHELADLSPESRAHYFRESGMDENVRKDVELLLALDQGASTVLEGHVAGVAGQALGRLKRENTLCGPYRLTTLVGRGGMGAVYRAERADGEITQSVAVKLLMPGVDDPHQRLRFLRERQILASLAHPNIARLLDAGHSEDGQPYLVMEYIEGKAIDAYTAGFTPRQKIALFLKVCAAVSYLHRHLVVHRDLKPGNILVAADGEPKLLDFGIAKLLDWTTDSTATAFRLLTPDYASPEQVTGGPITTASDVYSLGAVLYQLLTGNSPHEFEGDSPAAVALEISQGRITPPSRHAPDLRGDLELIIMKALRKEPQERYESVDALADDLRACLDWRPVRARSGDIWYRTRRWLRHNSIPAAAAAVVFISLSSGLYIANRQRIVAERRFDQLRQLSSRIIDVDSAIRKVPGSAEARKRLVAASLEYLEGLSREAHGNAGLSREIASGYMRLARIQGVNTEFNLGDTQAAEASLKKADALLESVLASHPNDREALLRSAQVAQDRMIVAFGDRRFDDVVVHGRQAVRRLEAYLPPVDSSVAGDRRSTPANPSSRQDRLNAAGFYINIAVNFVNAHSYQDGVLYARRASELAQSADDPNLSSQGLSVLANALRFQGDLNRALTAIRQARQFSERASYPNAIDRLFNLYGLTLREGLILGEAGAPNLGRPVEAAAVLQKALDMTEEVARNDSTEMASRNRLGSVAAYLGDILRDLDPQRSLAVYDLGIRRLAENPRSLKARRDRALLLANSSYPLRRLHRLAEAKQRIDASIALLKEIGDYPLDRLRTDSYAMAAMCALADHEADTGNPADALAIYEDVLRALLASGPQPETNLQDAASMTDIYKAMAALSRRNGRRQQASDFDSRRLRLWEHWNARLPGNIFIRRELDAAGHPDS